MLISCFCSPSQTPAFTARSQIWGECTASHGVPVYSQAFASIHFAHPRVEGWPRSWVNLSGWLNTKMAHMRLKALHQMHMVERNVHAYATFRSRIRSRGQMHGQTFSHKQLASCLIYGQTDKHVFFILWVRSVKQDVTLHENCGR